MRGRFMAMTLAGLALGSAPAYAGTWAKVSQDHHSNIVIPALIADGADVLVAWHYEPAPNSEEIDTQRFGSSVTQPYQPHGPRQVSFAGWSLGNPRLFATPAGVQMAFEGTQAISPTQVTTGLIVSGRSPDGTFATPVVAARPRPRGVAPAAPLQRRRRRARPAGRHAAPGHELHRRDLRDPRCGRHQ